VIFPPGATLLASPSDCVVSPDGATGECTLLALDPGTTQVLEFRLEATALGGMDLAATVTARNEGAGSDNFAQSVVEIGLVGCTDDVSIDGIGCRIAAILELVDGGFPEGDLGSKLTKQLAKAQGFVDEGAQAATDGNQKRAAARLRKAASALAKAARLFPNPKFAPTDPGRAAQLRGIAGATAEVQVDLGALRDGLVR
jgi:hypothetical protein